MAAGQGSCITSIMCLQSVLTVNVLLFSYSLQHSFFKVVLLLFIILQSSGFEFWVVFMQCIYLTRAFASLCSRNIFYT